MITRTITKSELVEIIKNHHMWLNDKGTGARANLRAADLSFTDLSYADLSSADLSHANLHSANLCSANLNSTDLGWANLHSTDLTYANLSYTNLSYANLSYANLSYTNLSFANLSFVNLSYANLNFANLVTFRFNRNVAYFTFDGRLRIGCSYLALEQWLKDYKSIGIKNEYTKDEISAYGYFIKLCIKLQVRKNKASK